MADLLNIKKLKALPKEQQAKLMRGIHVLLMSTERPELINSGLKILFTGRLEVIELRKTFREAYKKMTGEEWKYSGDKDATHL